MQRRKIKLIIQYDGYDYSGWQIQPGKRTIQGLLSDAVSDLVGWRTTVHGASRTDAGVSALGQVAVFEILSPIPTENFRDAINDRLPRDIVIISTELADQSFDIMGSVKNKLYRYTIYTGKARPVFDIRKCWHLPRNLDTAAMNRAAQFLVGKKDFKSFASSKDKRDSSVRTIFRCDVTGENKKVIVDVEGDSFLYNMVRNIVGTLAEIGLGRWPPEKMIEILDAKDRRAAGQIAPPQGLCLMWIKY